jgi:alpha-L-arabinofuranosidase
MIVDMEVLGEPKAWCTPEEYMIYLKASKEAIHSVAPEIPVIGVCPTGDGDSPRFMEWSEAVLKEGAEKYLDGFSYHPYGASNDFQTGDYFEATTTINKVKSLLKNPKTGMWNTECFQLPNSKYKRCDRWDASTALRHYLICLGNDIKMVAPYDLYLLRKDRLNPHVRIITPLTY